MSLETDRFSLIQLSCVVACLALVALKYSAVPSEWSSNTIHNLSLNIHQGSGEASSSILPASNPINVPNLFCASSKFLESPFIIPSRINCSSLSYFRLLVKPNLFISFSNFSTIEFKSLSSITFSYLIPEPLANVTIHFKEGAAFIAFAKKSEAKSLLLASIADAPAK